MARPVSDYRSVLGAKPLFSSVRDHKLRTKRKPGHVEIVRDHKTGEWVKITYDEQVSP